ECGVNSTKTSSLPEACGHRVAQETRLPAHSYRIRRRLPLARIVRFAGAIVGGRIVRGGSADRFAPWRGTTNLQGRRERAPGRLCGFCGQAPVGAQGQVDRYREREGRWLSRARKGDLQAAKSARSRVPKRGMQWRTVP